MRHDDAYLLDMLLAAREARKFAANLTFEAFERNRMAQLAILKAVEMVEEAASRISPEGKETHAEIPWTGIVSCMGISTSTCGASGRPCKKTSPV